MRVDVVVNAQAGSVDEADERREVSTIETAFTEAGIEVEVHVEAPQDFADVLPRLWEAEPRPDAILVAGGDGTVNCAAGVAAGTDMVLGVLPFGTFDHFAKDLGMPTDMAEAAHALVSGEIRKVDVAEVNGQVFVNNSVLGAYPVMVAIRDRLREEHGWGKVRAVPVAAIRVLRNLPMHRLTLEGEGLVRRHVRTPFVFVGNGVYDNEDGGLHRREAMTDGKLGVAVARVMSRWGLFRVVVQALLLGSQKARDLDVAEVRSLVVRTRTKRVRVALDGEVAWIEPPISYRTRPGALNVLAPPRPSH
jgi:diacylglycerol kinase family enzyme